MLPPIVRPMGPSKSPSPKNPLDFFFVEDEEEVIVVGGDDDELACDVASFSDSCCCFGGAGRSSATAVAVVFEVDAEVPRLACESSSLAEARAGQRARRFLWGSVCDADAEDSGINLEAAALELASGRPVATASEEKEEETERESAIVAFPKCTHTHTRARAEGGCN